MKSRFFILPFLSLIVGCGAAASLPTETDSNAPVSALQNAIWHPEFGDQMTLNSPTDGLLGEDGSALGQSILLSVPSTPSSYIHGVMLMDIPDRPLVQLQTRVGFVSGSAESEPLFFRVYVQNGEAFTQIAEVKASYDGRLDPLTVELSSFRGQNRLVIFSVSTLSGAPLTSSEFWSTPILLTP